MTRAITIILKQKRVTSEDIARLAGVSRATVSYVLNGRDGTRISPVTRGRVLEAARTAGYQRNSLAAALNTGRIHTVGLVTSPHGLTEGRNTYCQYLFLEISLAAAQAKMQSMMFMDNLATDQNSSAGLHPGDLLDGRLDGVIIFGHNQHEAWVRRISDLGFPFVEIGASWGPFAVQGDNHGGMEEAVAHLWGLGHRRIAHWTLPIAGVTLQARRDGFRDALRRRGVPDTDSLVVSALDAEPLTALLRGPDRPTAVMTFNDAMAVAALSLFQSLGRRVPQDISLVGYDNDLRAVTTLPRLTTVAHPLRLMAQAAMRKLMAQIEGRATQTETTIVPAHLVVRDSTAPPPCR